MSSVTIVARDLSVLSRKVRRVRQHQPETRVLVDIDVAIADDAAAARAKLLNDNVTAQPDSLVYVGTPRGLAGLLRDIHALRLADAVTIRPLIPAADLELVRAEVLPSLQRDLPGFPVHIASSAGAARFAGQAP